MSTIDKLDQNFAVKTVIEDTLTFTDCKESPFQVYGLLSTEEGFVRMPADIASKVNANVSVLFRNTAGGRLRFQTSSPKIAIRARMANIARMPHFSLTGTAGFDLYEDNTYRGTFNPPYDVQTGYESMLTLPGSRLRNITIHFPLYSDVRSLEIGLSTGSSLQPAPAYSRPLPVVYYGSSITQGGCASRPGNCYENIISRRLDCDHINLGFSGGARGEDTIAAYIAGLSMSAFVYDYDHNAPDVDHLQATHNRLFQTIRQRQPLLPVIMVSRPQPNPGMDDYRRRSVILSTYQNALAAGDQNVYFIDGTMMLQAFGGDGGTVDACHPNDMGFQCMALAIGAVLEKILSSSRLPDMPLQQHKP